MLDQPIVSSVIVGARTAAQFSDTLACCEWKLLEEARTRRDKVSALIRRYPQAMEEAMAERRNQAMRLPKGKAG